MRAGKSFHLDLDAADPQEAERLLRGMCEKLLANTVVEDFEIQLEAV